MDESISLAAPPRAALKLTRSCLKSSNTQWCRYVFRVHFRCLDPCRIHSLLSAFCNSPAIGEGKWFVWLNKLPGSTCAALDTARARDDNIYDSTKLHRPFKHHHNHEGSSRPEWSRAEERAKGEPYAAAAPWPDPTRQRRPRTRNHAWNEFAGNKNNQPGSSKPHDCD